MGSKPTRHWFCNSGKNNYKFLFNEILNNALVSIWNCFKSIKIVFSFFIGLWFVSSLYTLLTKLTDREWILEMKIMENSWPWSNWKMWCVYLPCPEVEASQTWCTLYIQVHFTRAYRHFSVTVPTMSSAERSESHNYSARPAIIYSITNWENITCKY